jgi:hypothetical protein
MDSRRTSWDFGGRFQPVNRCSGPGWMCAFLLTNVAALTRESDTLSVPNYTGSLGFGQSSVNALVRPGACGIIDVEDCMALTKEVIRRGYGREGKGQQFVMGGSHGGFITAHCESLMIYV